MFKDICSAVTQNKNILMLVSTGIYLLALFGVLSDNSVLFALLLTGFLILSAVKNLFPFKIILIWTLIFYFGILNTSLRIKDTDNLLNLAPVNSVIYGKILSIPQTKNNDKTQLFFSVNKIEYDGIVKEPENEKVLVTISEKENFNIYDSYKIRGRLSTPFKAGNPSQFDYGNYLRNFDTYAVFYGRNPYNMKDLNIPCYEKIPSEKSLTEKSLQKINNYRENILKIHARYLASPNLEILGGIVFGDDAVSPPENIKQSFINSGLLHILAASGMNVGFIYSFFFLIMNFIKVPFKLNISICILLVLTYVLMTGLGASVVRAALMLIFVLIGKLIDRDANNISLLSFVAFLMLIYNPMYINDVGFQLSFVVTFGLLFMMPYIIRSEHPFANWIIGSITVPVIAQLWVIPIQIFYFNNISIYSVFANIMSVPILFVISFGGFISSLVSIIQPISDFVCMAFDFVLNPLISLLINISDFWGALPHSAVQTTHPNPLQIILYYIILINLTLFLNKEFRNKYIKLMRITLPVFVSVLLLSTISLPNKNLEITAFDVGNADAFMIKTPDNKYMMIDTGKAGYNGGKSQAKLLIIKYFIDRGINNLDTLIVTHFDNDHCGGTVDLLKEINVKTLYVNSLDHTSPQAQEIYKTAKQRNTNVIQAENNQSVYNNKLKITNYLIKNGKDNESSIITLLTYGKFSMLFTGDAGIETFNKLKNNLPQNITVLKVPHHGAPGVINKSIADYLNPEYAIISTGENKFGHPSIYTTETLRKSKVLRTDIHNSVRITVTPKEYRVLTYNPKKKKYTN